MTRRRSGQVLAPRQRDGERLAEVGRETVPLIVSPTGYFELVIPSATPSDQQAEIVILVSRERMAQLVAALAPHYSGERTTLPVVGHG